MSKITSLTDKKDDKELDEAEAKLLNARIQLLASIRSACNSLIDSGLSNLEIVGALFDLQCDYREAMYEED